MKKEEVGFKTTNEFIYAKYSGKLFTPLQVCEVCGGAGGDTIDGENVFLLCESCEGTTFKLNKDFIKK
jgi:hypothetical protein